jgi:hypothetical protein
MTDALTSEHVGLSRLVAEAVVLAGGEHQCAKLGHVWKSIGGRPCPFSEWGCGESQAVHECVSCGDIDYGTSKGEPGFDWCAGQDFDCGGESRDRQLAAESAP